jgi:hypothetical protein
VGPVDVIVFTPSSSKCKNTRFCKVTGGIAVPVVTTMLSLRKAGAKEERRVITK